MYVPVCRQGRGALDRAVQKGLAERVTSEGDLKEAGERTVQIPGRNVSARGNSACKGPEVGVSPVCWTNSGEAGGADGGRRGQRRNPVGPP